MHCDFENGSDSEMAVSDWEYQLLQISSRTSLYYMQKIVYIGRKPADSDTDYAIHACTMRNRRMLILGTELNRTVYNFC